MKTIRFLLLALFAALLAACSQDPLSNALPEPPAPADPHKIPVEKALGELEELLRVIDAPETRSGGARRVASVEALGDSALARASRAGNDAAAAAEIGDLVYIANFQNGEGYAILGADDRIESVIAVTERGSLTPAQLAAAANGQYDGVEAPPVVPEIGDYLIERIGEIHKYDSLTSWIDGPTLVDKTYGAWYAVSQKGPYCKMKWGQDAPYNMKTPVKDGQNCVVGCVAVALGQIVATNYYNKYYPGNTSPEPSTFGGQSINWSEIFNAIKRYSNNPNSRRYYFTTEDNSEVRAVAGFLSGIGSAIGMEYGVSSSSASRHDAARFLKAMGFRDVDIYYFSEGKLKEMVADRGLPTYIRGSGLDGGHAWVVDGVKKWNREVTYRYTNPVSSGTKTEEKQLYHCNFGWAGICDGYYYAGSVFNPRGNPQEREIGDRESNSTGDNFTTETRIIYYNLF